MNIWNLDPADEERRIAKIITIPDPVKEAVALLTTLVTDYVQARTLIRHGLIDWRAAGPLVPQEIIPVNASRCSHRQAGYQAIQDAGASALNTPL